MTSPKQLYIPRHRLLQQTESSNIPSFRKTPDAHPTVSEANYLSGGHSCSDHLEDRDTKDQTRAQESLRTLLQINGISCPRAVDPKALYKG